MNGNRAPAPQPPSVGMKQYKTDGYLINEALTVAACRTEVWKMELGIVVGVLLVT